MNKVFKAALCALALPFALGLGACTAGGPLAPVVGFAASDAAAAQALATAAEPTDPNASLRAACWGGWAAYLTALSGAKGAGVMVAAEGAIEGQTIFTSSACNVVAGEIIAIIAQKLPIIP
jgi:hypothetical protein